MESSEKTMNDVFLNRANKYGNRLAIEKKMGGVWHGATWTGGRYPDYQQYCQADERGNELPPELLCAYPVSGPPICGR